MLKEQTVWICDRCERIFPGEKPTQCTCETAIQPENVVGAFEILSKANGQKFNVICLFCGLDRVVHRSNIRRQKSCGCKPKHIEILFNTEDKVRYTCNKCGKTISTDLPIERWCHEIEDEE